MPRKYTDKDGILRLGDGEYGFDSRDQKWYVRPPGQHMGSIPEHKIEEHSNNTITVTPSILLREPTGEFDTKGNPILRDVWHGHLIQGEWKET